MKVKVIWNFEDTEYENFQYEEARKAAGLPKTIKLKDFEEEDEEIESYLFENYGFEPESYEIHE